MKRFLVPDIKHSNIENINGDNNKKKDFATFVTRVVFRVIGKYAAMKVACCMAWSTVLYKLYDRNLQL